MVSPGKKPGRRVVERGRGGVVLAVVAALSASTLDARAESGPFLTIETTPPGASVYLDGKEQGLLGTTPLRIRTPLGTHKLTLELSGFVTLEQGIRVTQAQRFSFALTPDVARLEVRAPVTDESAADGELFIDGIARGTVPATVEVQSGQRLIEVRKPGHAPFSQQIELRATEHKLLWVTLVRVPQTVAAVGALPRPLVATVDFYAHAPRDSYHVGVGNQGCATPCKLTLPAGDAVVDISGPRTFQTTIRLRHGASRFEIDHRRALIAILGPILTAVGAALIPSGTFLLYSGYAGPDRDRDKQVAPGFLCTLGGIGMFVGGIYELATLGRNRVERAQ